MIDSNTLTGRWWLTIDAFQERAERVLDSAIARREDFATIGTQLKFTASVMDGNTSWEMVRQIPPEAETESAAARIRPLFLKKDPVFHGTVTAAIGGLAQRFPSHYKTAIKPLKDAWGSFEKNYRWSMAVADQRSSLGGKMRTDRQIACDFLYGYLVHADAAARERLTGVSAEDRLLAAVVWVTDATRLTEATKRLIIDLTNAGALSLRPS